MKLFVSISILAVLSLALLFSDTMVFRALMAKEFECSFAQIKNMPADADFLAMGSSRVQIAIDPDLLQERSESIDHAFNLAKVGSSPERNYSWLKSLLQKGLRPKAVYVEVDLRQVGNLQSRPKWKRSAYAPMASYAVQFEQVNFYQLSVLEDFYIVSDSIIKKLDASAAILTGGRLLQAARADFKNNNAPNACVVKSFSHKRKKKSIRDIKRWKRKFNKYQKQSGSEFRENFDLGSDWGSKRELYFLDRVQELSEEYNFELVVSRPWMSYERPLSPEDLAEIRTVIPNFAFPPESVVKETWPLFHNPRHMSFEAGDIYTVWLAQTIEKRLSADEQKGQ